MKYKIITCVICLTLICVGRSAFCGDIPPVPDNPAAAPSLNLEEIISRIESRYDVTGFSARFDQESTLKVMQITDTASGLAIFKRPGMMRWEYEIPEKQKIITNGKTIWIYRPEENQVMTGDALTVFGDGNGASFLSDIRTLRKKFTISFISEENDHYILKLVPKESRPDLLEIRLSIVTKTFDVVQVVTYNSFGDETKIKLSSLNFDKDIPDTLFSFEMPENIDILQLEN